jgi:putative ABC transport system permease protein
VTPEFIEEAAPEIASQGDPIILSLDDGTDPTLAAEQLRDAVDTAVELPLEQAAIRNVDRVRQLPFVMAGVVTLLAVVSLTHALVLAVGRHRHVLGVLKGLGFTRRQVSATVAWHATAYAVLAGVVAVPLGIALGRWGWSLVAGSLGVPSVPIVPLVAPVLALAGLVLLANLTAAYPAWRAARLSTAAALRTE